MADWEAVDADALDVLRRCFAGRPEAEDVYRPAGFSRSARFSVNPYVFRVRSMHDHAKSLAFVNHS
jgi:hypothetical protein